jgi:hypothetical protein
MIDILGEHEFSFDELTLAAASSSYYLKIKENFEKTNNFDRLSRESLDYNNNLFRVTLTIFLLLIACSFFISVYICVRCRRSRRNRRPIYNTGPDSVYQSTVEPVSSSPAAEQDETGMIIVPLEEEIILNEKEIIEEKKTLNYKSALAHTFKTPRAFKRRPLKKSIKNKNERKESERFQV